MADSQPTPVILTSNGRKVLAQGQTGLPIEIVRIAVGDGVLPDGTIIDDMTGLVHEVRDVPINSNTIVGDGTTMIEAVISNRDLATPYELREVGIFAIDNDTGDEVLYAYTNSGDVPWIFVPSANGPHAVDIMYELYTIIKQAANVVVNITEGYGYVTTAQLELRIGQMYGNKAPIANIWTSDDADPKKLRHSSMEDVNTYLFEHTIADAHEPVLLGFRPEDKKVFGIPLSQFETRAVRMNGGTPSMAVNDYPGNISGGDPSMEAADYEGTLEGGNPFMI